MKLSKHIAYKFLHDDDFILDIVNAHFKATNDIPEKIPLLYSTLSPTNNTNYYVTDTVIEKLDILKVTKKNTGDGENFNYTVFDEIANCKKTFIFSGNRLLRLKIDDNYMQFCFLTSTITEKGPYIKWVLFHINKKTGTLSCNFLDKDVLEVETLVYKLLCFVFLSENEEIIISPGSRYGTKKTGKIINEFKFPVTIINSKWNITSIRSEEFLVRPHLALRYFGSGRTKWKMVYINEYKKNGYTRPAANINHL